MEMQSINIQTTQNVSLRYHLAGLGHRIAATFIDFIILACFGIFFSLLLGFTENYSITTSVMVGLVIYLYFLLCEIIMNGQTIGKKVMKIKVIKVDSTKPSIGAYVLRWILLPIDYFMMGGVAMIFIILTPKGQRLGDLVANTTVVLDKREENVLQKKKAIIGSVDQDYQPVFPEASRLSTEDISLMRQAVEAFQNRSQRAPMEMLKEKIEAKLNITSGLHPIKFFHTLIKDHTYYSWRDQ